MFWKKDRKDPGDPQQKSPEAAMVFEEVNEGQAEEMVFEEVAPDPVMEAATKILGLEQKLGDAKIQGESRERQTILEVRLAQAKYEQARLNERNGRGEKGSADTLLTQWQSAQDALEGFRGSEIEQARKAAEARSDHLDADDIAQMRRHQ